MSREMWELDIYRQQGNRDALVATHDFHNLISLRIAIIENREEVSSWASRCTRHHKTG
jgi:hypothetical protein